MAQDPDAHSSTHRVEAFSDGVFAIAITLLIIEIAVPHLEGDESLGDKLRELWPSYAAYVLSFITIGIYWANHHSFFELFRRTNHIFLMLNVVFLMAVAFLPFPTTVLGDYLKDDANRDSAVTFYALGLLMPAVGWCALWSYGRWRGLLVQALDLRTSGF
ncbi:MAG: TMEM175 family protein [Dehalococcoidia bacterium]